MQIREFNKAKHLVYIQDWMQARKMEGQKEAVDGLPEVGFIAFSDNTPIAAGFLRKMEGGYGFVDSFITNPIETPEKRDAAMSAVLTKVMEAAKSMKLKQTIVLSKDEHTIQRAERFGYVKLVHTVLTLENV